MAFMLHTTDDGHIPAWEYLPCGAITPKVGMALTQTSGKLAIATGSTAPTYISMTESAAALAAGTLIPVIRVNGNMVFKTTASAALTGVNIGEKVTLHASSGLQVTATTTGGIAELVGMAGTASGSEVLVRFAAPLPPAEEDSGNAQG